MNQAANSKTIFPFSKTSHNLVMEPETRTRVEGLPSNPLLRRRNSISTSMVVPSKLSITNKPHHQSSRFTSLATAADTSSTSSVDFNLVSIKPVISYTSLKDMLPITGVKSPKDQPQVQSGFEISICNRSFKQTSWAHIQPMSTSPGSASRGFLPRMWARFSGSDLFKNNPVTSLFSRALRFMGKAIDGMLRILWVRKSR